MKRVKFTILSMLLGLASMQAQTDVTHYITNPDFEAEIAVTGWSNSGIGPQGNNEFTMKHGNTYVETWTGWGGTVGDRYVKQVLEGLPAGVYTLTVAGHNIQQGEPNAIQTGAFVYANNNMTEVSQPNDYSVTTTCTDGILEVGARTIKCTGNWVCFDNFRLTYTLDVDSLQPYIGQLLAEADAINKHLSGEAQDELDAAYEGLKKYVGTKDSEGLDNALKRLQIAIRAYGLTNATDENPIEMTELIMNPSFENGTKGWTTSMSTQGNDVFNIKAGNTYLEKWTGRGATIGASYGTGYARQVITDLPAGNYRLTCVAQNIQEDSPNSKYEGAYIYGGYSQTAVNVRGEYQVDFTCITGEVEIGFRGDEAKGNWIAVDNFRLFYIGSSAEANQALLQARITTAEELAAKKMQVDTLAQLNQAIEAAKNITSNEEIPTIALTLDGIIAKAESSVKAYSDLKTTIMTIQIKANNGADKNGIAELQQAIDEANALYEAGQATNDELVLAGQALEEALFIFNVSNPTGTAPTVTTHPVVIYGCKAAVGRMEVVGRNIKERGFCWSEGPDPTIYDNRSHTTYNFNGEIYLMHDLKPSTTYYVRAYAISNSYAVGYGDIVRIITLPEAKVTFSYNWAGDEETNARIYGSAVTTVSYLNTWTSIRGFNASINYDAGDDGAHGGYGGWITIGAGFAQNPGTIMHEIGHGIGVGQHWRYTSWDSPLHPTMYWTGERANRVFAFFENQEDEFDSEGNFTYGGNHTVSDGDRVHVCYGLSGVTAPIDLLRQAAYYQGMYEDGMPAVGDGACPFYSFDCNEEEKYYLTNEGVATGRRFLQETSTGVLKNPYVTIDKVIEDDSYAWYVKYDPMTGFYHIRNAKTGKNLTFNYDAFGVKERTELTKDDNIHLMPSRLNETIKLNGIDKPAKSYWIARGNRAENPEVLNASISAFHITSPQLDFYDTAKTQRWYFLSGSEIKQVIEAAGITELNYDEELATEIEGYYDVAGNRLSQPHVQGITIVRYKNGHVEKIINK